MKKTSANIWEAFSQEVNLHPDQVACHFKEEAVFKHYSYEELFQRTLQFALVLKESDIKPHATVAVLAENHPDFLMAFLALMAIDAVLVPLDVQYTEEQIQKILAHSKADALLVSKRTLEQKPNIHAQRLIVIDGGGHKDIHQEKLDEWPQAKKDEPAVLFYTSGTTDEPKGVCLTHHNLLSNVRSLQQLNLTRSNDVFLSFLPLHHAYSFTATVLLPLLSGSQVALCATVASIDLMTTMKETGVTIFVGVPQVFHLMVKGILTRMKKLPFVLRGVIGVLGPLAAALRPVIGPTLSKLLFKQIHQNFGGKVRYMISGGARLEPEAARNFHYWGFTMLEGYGLTETSPVAAFTRPSKYRIGSVGEPLPGVEIQIHEPNGEGVGEVWIRGDNVMAGYYANEEASREVFTEDDWFKSGDLGSFDEDGCLFLQGRLREVIILSNGKNIQPEEVERHYGKIGLIKEVAVFAQKASGETTLEADALTGLIYLDEEKVQNFDQMNLAETIKWELDNYSAQLPTYKRLKGFSVVKDPLPRTRLGKLKRYQLPELYQSLHVGDEVNEAPEKLDVIDNLDDAARQFIEETLKRSVKDGDYLELDLGLDSLNRIELLLNLQDHLDLDMTEEQAMDFFSCQTIGDLKAKLNKHYGSSPVQTSGEAEGFKWEDILKEDPTEESKNKIQLTNGFLRMTVSIFIVVLLKSLFKVLFFLRHQGRDQLPSKGPYILVPNHTSYLDGLFIMSAVPFNVIMQTYFIGMSQFFDTPALRPVSKFFRLVSMEFNFQFMETLKLCAYILDHKKIVCYFPEGQRSVDGEVKEFKKGIGVLLKELNIPVIPVYIEGAYKTWNRHQKFPHLAPIRVCFGKPLNAKDLEDNTSSSEDVYSAISANLRDDVAALKP